MTQATSPGKEPNSRPPVVLLPPLLNPHHIMRPLAWRLRRAGRQTHIFKYHSHRRDIPDNARDLAAWLNGLKVQEIDVVAFSLGCILLRWASNHCDIPRLRRVVFLGPPNQGASMADLLHKKLGPAYRVIWGRSSLQLRRGDAGLAQRAGTLPAGTELGVIAGGTGHGKGFNPFIPGDNDLTVAVQETVMPGLRDFTLARATHTGLPLLARPARLAIRFLDTGGFRDRKKHR